MPISAQEWRVRTGMLNTSRGSPRRKRAPHFFSFFPRFKTAPHFKRKSQPCESSPPSWNGYRITAALLCLPLVYKVYTALATIVVCLVGGESRRRDSCTEATQYTDVAGYEKGPCCECRPLASHLFLLSVFLHAALVMVLAVMEDKGYINKAASLTSTYQWRCTPGALSFRGVCRSLIRGARSIIPRKTTVVQLSALCLSLVGAGSVVHHLPAVALLMLVLLCGDVERNPGPPGCDMKTLMMELNSVKTEWFQIGIALGVEVHELRLIETQRSDIGRRLSDMIQLWLDENTDVPVCWESIVNALKSPLVNKQKLANRLHLEYCQSVEAHTESQEQKNSVQTATSLSSCTETNSPKKSCHSQTELVAEQDVGKSKKDSKESEIVLKSVTLTHGCVQIVRNCYSSPPRSDVPEQLATDKSNETTGVPSGGPGGATASAAAAEHQQQPVLSPTCKSPDSTKLTFSNLVLSDLTDSEREKLQARLRIDSVHIIERFQDFLDTIMDSLEERKVPVKKIVRRIMAFGPLKPVFEESDAPILHEELSKLQTENDASIDNITELIRRYSSFFNYRIVARIVKSLGTPKDKLELEEYERAFFEYAKRKLYECPSELGIADVNQPKVFAKLDDTYDKYTLNELNLFCDKLSKVFNLSDGMLQLVRVELGCFKLTFQVPMFLHQTIFPLSTEQERALAELGVVRLTSGSYTFSRCKDDMDQEDDNKRDKPDDDSAIGISTAKSELTDFSEDIIDRELSDPYQEVQHDANKKPADEPEGIDLTLHIASHHGKIDLVKTLVEANLFNPLLKDRHGNTVLHYAAEGNQLEVIKYFVKTQGCHPVSFSHNGETPLHIAARLGHSALVEYLVTEEQLDPMEQEDTFGRTVLHASCLGGNVGVVHFLVTEASRYLPMEEIALVKTKYGHTLLHFASVGGHLNIVEYLISELQCDPNVPDPKGSTPLHAAAVGGHLDIVKHLIDDHSCDPSQPNINKYTPLHSAASKGHLNVVKFLTIDKHVDPACKDSDGHTPLDLAASNGHIEIVRFLISELKCDPNTPNGDGFTPLHAAAVGGHLDIVKHLINDHICDPSQPNINKPTPLHIAAAKGHLNVVKFLTLDKCVDPTCRTTKGNTPLHLAALIGHIEIVRFLISELKCDPNTPNGNGFTPLHAAAVGGHLDIVKHLINDHICDPSQPNINKPTPLHIAASKGHLNVVNFLTLDKHIDPACRDSNGHTPLDLAASNGHIEIVRFLISELKCDPNTPNGNGFTPLYAAAEGGHLDIVKHLINDHICDPSQLNINKPTPLHSAASKGHLNVVNYLTIDKHVDPACKDSDGHTPLDLAASNGHIEIVRFLISELKCNPNTPNGDGFTPLHAAAEGGHLDIVKHLINDHICDPSQPNINKPTPLHIAAAKGHLNVVKFLTLEKCVDPTCRTSKGNTPLHLAALIGHIEIVRFLISELKCNPNTPNGDGFTPLHAAAVGGHLDIVKHLINDHICDPSQPNINKPTPLHIAASKGHLNVVKFLTLDKHVDPACRDSNGATPLDLAALNGHHETAAFLFDAVWELRGVEVCGETTVTVTSAGQCFCWNSYGLALHIPEQSLPKGIEQCTLSIKASLAGDYEFLESSHLVSAVYWIRCEPKCRLSKPISVEMQHCAPKKNSARLSFVRSHCTQQQLPYTFKQLGGHFTEDSSCGRIDLNSFCGIAITQDGSDEREYCASVFYLDKDRNSCDVHFVFTWDSPAHLKGVKNWYEQQEAKCGPTLQIEFKATAAITLDIPRGGTTIEEMWMLKPLFHPKVTKRRVDSYKPDRTIPSCQLEIVPVSSSSELRRLTYEVKLHGAKRPYDYITISYTPRTTHSQGAARESSQLSELVTELDKVAYRWFDIGINLHLPVGTLKTLETDHLNSKRCLREMLILWLQRNKPCPTWAAVSDAIQKLGDHSELARDLRRKYSKTLHDTL